MSPQELAQLTSQFHLTMAELIEAEAAEKPDEAKIKELIKKVEELREELGPRGGPGRGQGRGHGQGRGTEHDRG